MIFKIHKYPSYVCMHVFMFPSFPKVLSISQTIQMYLGNNDDISNHKRIKEKDEKRWNSLFCWTAAVPIIISYFDDLILREQRDWSWKDKRAPCTWGSRMMMMNIMEMIVFIPSAEFHALFAMRWHHYSSTVDIFIIG